MKRPLAFLGFLIPWAFFILDLPDLAERAGKWIPILNAVGTKLTTGVSSLVDSLPKAPACGNCLKFYLFWPTVVTMLIVSAAYILFFVVYARLQHEPEPVAPVGRPHISVILFVVMQFVLLHIVQSWLLYRYSGFGFAKSLTILLFNTKVAAARDKNFFLHASNIYGVIIVVSYLSVVMLGRWLWGVFEKNPEARPPTA